MRRCIAVDFDGTLSEYHGFRGVGVYGPPVPAMLERVKKWISEDIEVVIFTARVSPRDYTGVLTSAAQYEAYRETMCIMNWCVEHVGCELLVTGTKMKRFSEIWDDRAVSVQSNTGEVICRNV
jgi:hypothetical protein